MAVRIFGLAVEALALHEALLVGRNLQFEKGILESDNLGLIEACRVKNTLENTIYSI